MRSVYGLFLSILLAGCSTLQIPTPTPTRVLSGPTLEPTPEVIPAPPSEVPGSFVDPFGSNDPTVAALPNDLELPPLAVESADGTQSVTITLLNEQLAGTLYNNVPMRSPGVLLLGDGLVTWNNLPNTLETNGYVVLSVALPTVTSPQSISNIIASFSDLALGENSLLDPSRIAVIGERRAADLALRACAVDLRCDALGLLSPQDETGSSLVMEQFSPRPALITASQDDILSFGLSENLVAASQGVAVLQPFVSAGTGAEITVNRPDFADLVVNWLNRSL